MTELLPPVTPCRSCRAPVRWVVTSKGKKMPIDDEPAPNGNIEIQKGVAVYVRAEENVARFWSHFATCADATGWRQR